MKSIGIVLNGIFADMEKLGKEQVASGGVDPREVTITRSADMRYVRQGREISVPIPNGKLSRESVEAIQQSFQSVYQDLYSRYLTDTPMEVVSWRVVVSGPRPTIQLKKSQGSLRKRSGAEDEKAGLLSGIQRVSRSVPCTIATGWGPESR